jgi:hypothetical protein
MQQILKLYFDYGIPKACDQYLQGQFGSGRIEPIAALFILGDPGMAEPNIYDYSVVRCIGFVNKFLDVFLGYNFMKHGFSS